MSHGPLAIEDLRRQLAVHVIGRRLELHEELPSTNLRALACACDPAAHGLVVLAERQTAGRGRLSRCWHSPKGASILMSVLLLLEDGSSAARTLWVWSALAASDAVDRAAGVRVSIKWPNDLVVGARKLCGILIESRPELGRRAYAVGIGVNCLQHARHFPPEIRDTATSLELESSSAIDRLAVARELILSLDCWLEKVGRCPLEVLRNAWLQRALPLGTRLHVEREGRHFAGRVVDLDPQSGLLMELEHGGRQLFDPFTTTVLSDPTRRLPQ